VKSAMLQMLKIAMSRVIKTCAAMMKALFKMCIAILKVLLITAMFAVMVFGCLSALLAVGPHHTPSSMEAAWEMLYTMEPDHLSNLSSLLDGGASPPWEVRDSSAAISMWVAQMPPVVDLLATSVGLARDDWLRAEFKLSLQRMDKLIEEEPKVQQALCGVWIFSTVSIVFLVMSRLIAATRLGCRCMRWMVRAVYCTRTTGTASDTVLSDGAGPTPKSIIPEAPQALGETTNVNIIATSKLTEEKKGGRKRLESPVVRVNKAWQNKEDVAPWQVSPLRRKESELNELRDAGIVGRRLRQR
jgi:hypothetical protein